MRDVGFYLLIAVILLMTIFALRGGLDGSVQTSYGEIRRLLEQELVTQVQVEDNTVTLWLKEPVNGQSTITYDVANPDWFYNDFNDLIVQQVHRGVITDYNYPQIGRAHV